MRVLSVGSANEATLSDLHPEFQDERLSPLLLHYKARNYPRSLSADESAAWEKWRVEHLQKQLPGFMKSMERISRQDLNDKQQFIMQELQLWLESVAPIDGGDDSAPD